MVDKWTEPFYGYTHYLGCDFPVRKMIIIYDDTILAERFDLNSPHPYTPTKDKWFKKGELEKAKRWLIRQ